MHRSSIAIAAIITIAGCATQPQHRSIDRLADHSSEPAINNSLASMRDQQASTPAQSESPADDLSDAFASNAEALRQSSLDTSSQQTQPQQALEANTDPIPQSTALDENSLDTNLAATPERTTTPIDSSSDTTTKVIELSPDEKRAQLIEELASILRQDSRTSATPAEALTQLAALELLEPGILTDSTLNAPALTQRETEIVTALRTMFRTSAEGTRSNAGDVSHIARAVSSASDTLGASDPLAIVTAALCSKVEGFGRYTELPVKILAGRSQPAIVYVELENFASRAGADTRGNTAHIVEITQELSLYHDADGLLAWKQPQQLVTDTSRSKRNDFFLVQRIDLPQTLTVGIYRLKVTISDKVSGHSAEIILPLEVVADANLIRKYR
ncbi:MAG: hypothetical protein ACYTF7_06660 [Planctomycetota bacterium]|jgi:hypothetical protein